MDIISRTKWIVFLIFTFWKLTHFIEKSLINNFLLRKREETTFRFILELRSSLSLIYSGVELRKLNSKSENIYYIYIYYKNEIAYSSQKIGSIIK